MTFEFKQIPVELDFAKTNKLLYGEPGTGKTTLAAAMIDKEGRPPYFIMTEKGNGVLPLWGQLVTNWDGFLKLKELLLTQKLKELQEKFSCLVFDVISDLDEMSAAYVAKKNKVPHIGDLPHGKGWYLHEDEFKKGIKDFLPIMPCSFITHVTEKEMLWNGEMVKTQAPRLTKRTMPWINGKVDFVMYLQAPSKKSEHRIVSMTPMLDRIAKARYPHMNRTFANHKDQPARTWAEMREAFAQVPQAQEKGEP